jgi:AcrR family transcriptional regulator
MAKQKAVAKAPDRSAKERALISAAKKVLADAGFQGLGVNAVARAAGCDKQLIYRYFGGIEGLVEAIGTELATRLRDGLAPLAAMGRPVSYADMVQRLALGLLQVLRDDALLRKIAAWEVSDGSPLVRSLTLARSKGMMLWMAETRGNQKPPPGIDAPAANAFVIAAVQHLVLAASAAGAFAGVALHEEKDWERVRTTIKSVVASIYDVS